MEHEIKGKMDKCLKLVPKMLWHKVKWLAGVKRIGMHKWIVNILSDEVDYYEQSQDKILPGEKKRIKVPWKKMHYESRKKEKTLVCHTPN